MSRSFLQSLSTYALILAAGLDGFDRDISCPPPVNNLNIYEMDESDLQKRGINQLPGSLAEALRELEGDSVIKDTLGVEAYTAFTRAKQAEWDEYSTRVMDWEVEYYHETA